jgi:predicted Fe-Mo cluster-binding NifX family protein
LDAINKSPISSIKEQVSSIQYPVTRRKEIKMKICITSQGNMLDSEVDPRFGRCAYFLIVNTDTMEFEAVENSSAQTMGGAGIQAGKFVLDKGVKAVLTGNVGPNAFQTLQAGGIEIITNVSGKVRDIVNQYKNGELKATGGPNVQSHFGMK